MGVYRGVDVQTAGVYQIRCLVFGIIVLLHQILNNFIQQVFMEVGIFAGLVGELCVQELRQLLSLGFVVLVFGDVTLILHQRQTGFPTILGFVVSYVSLSSGVSPVPSI